MIYLKSVTREGFRQFFARSRLTGEAAAECRAKTRNDEDVQEEVHGEADRDDRGGDACERLEYLAQRRRCARGSQLHRHREDDDARNAEKHFDEQDDRDEQHRPLVPLQRARACSACVRVRETRSSRSDRDGLDEQEDFEDAECGRVQELRENQGTYCVDGVECAGRVAATDGDRVAVQIEAGHTEKREWHLNDENGTNNRD